MNYSTLRPGDDLGLTESTACLTDACMSLNDLVAEILGAKGDVIGIKPKLASVREQLVKIHELLDHGDGILLDVTDHMRTCHHPQEGHMKSMVKNSTNQWFWACGYCGDVYTGLKWAAQPDTAIDRA